ncbi:MAG: helix-turn-helix transcriptional regulator [Cyanobacteria bacterium J06638_22]
MPVRNKIKQFLDSRDITRYRFMKDVGLAQATAYSLYDKPYQLPSSTVLSKICDTYEVQPGEILEWIPGTGVVND